MKLNRLIDELEGAKKLVLRWNESGEIPEIERDITLRNLQNAYSEILNLDVIIGAQESYDELEIESNDEKQVEATAATKQINEDIEFDKLSDSGKQLEVGFDDSSEQEEADDFSDQEEQIEAEVETDEFSGEEEIVVYQASDDDDLEDEGDDFNEEDSEEGFADIEKESSSLAGDKKDAAFGNYLEDNDSDEECSDEECADEECADEECSDEECADEECADDIDEKKPCHEDLNKFVSEEGFADIEKENSSLAGDKKDEVVDNESRFDMVKDLNDSEDDHKVVVAAVPHGAATAVSHGEATAVSHGEATAVSHGAATAVPHRAATAVPHGAATAVSNGAATAVPHGEATDEIKIFEQVISKQLKDRFIRELFLYEEQFFTNEVAKLSALPDFDSALIYISEKYNWSADSKAAEEFTTLLANFEFSE